MEFLFLQYPKCSTCRKAKEWLDHNGVDYQARSIVEQRPTAEELKSWIAVSGLPIKRFFNTSGMVYREQNIKEKLLSCSKEEMIDLLASDGMLVRRPLLIGDGVVLVGFQPDIWEEIRGK